MEATTHGNGQTAEIPAEIAAAVCLLDPLRPLRGEHLAIVGFSETTRHLAPFDDESAEIWICNRLGLQPGISRWDRHFDPHPLDFSKLHHKPRDWETYAEWFAADYGDRMIYLPQPDPAVLEVPNAVSFPRDHVVEEVKREYFASAIGWQLGLALLLHGKYGTPTKISLYGIDLRSEAEYEYQRPNAEWLCGIAEGRGIEVYIPPESAMLNQDKRAPLYGFEIYGGSSDFGLGSVEKALEEREIEIGKQMAALKKENDRIVAELTTWDGARQESLQWRQRVVQYRRGGKL